MRAGFGVLEAGNVADAIKLLEALGSEVDLLLTDYRMPRANGDVLIRWARDRCPQFPILCLTGFPEEVPVDVPLLAKPIGPRELVAAVRSHLVASGHRADDTERPTELCDADR